MTALVAFDAQGRWGQTLVCEAPIRAALHATGLGLDFGRWPLHEFEPGAPLDAVLAAYAPQLDALRGRLQVRSIDRVALAPGHADWPALRARFIAEHTHADAEIRFFLGGAGLFYIRVDGGHVGLLCEAGDWVVLPAGTRHFFDAGEQPDFDALRLFSAPDGWVARPTGAPAAALPLMDEFVAQLADLTGFGADDAAALACTRP